MLEPLGSQARFEPAPGFRPPWGIALLGGIGLALLFAAVTAGARRWWRAGPRSCRPRAGHAVHPARIGRPPVLMGIGLAARPAGGGGVRTAATVAGLAWR